MLEKKTWCQVSTAEKLCVWYFKAPTDSNSTSLMSYLGLISFSFFSTGHYAITKLVPSDLCGDGVPENMSIIM